MPKIKVLVTIAQKPNFDPWALKYSVLALNPRLKAVEFWFADSHSYVFEPGIVNYRSAVGKYEAAQDIFFIQKDDPPEYTVAIISSAFDNNHFSLTEGDLSIITTDAWERNFSPPSVFEYVIHSLAVATVFMDSKLKLDSHEWVKGCIMDFNRFKLNNRASILCGYISEQIRERCLAIRGPDFADDLDFIVGRSWLGSLENRGSVAWNLKHTYKLDIFRDSGFTKRWHEKLLEKFYEVPQKATMALITAGIGAVLGYYFKK